MIEILLATYNGSRFLREQIDSLLAQEGGTPFRVLARDDGSSDETPAILASYEERFPERFRVLRDDTGATGSAIRNFERLLAASDADVVMLCDQDDVWLPNKLRDTYALMQRTADSCPGVPLLVHTDLAVVDAALSPIAPSLARMQRLYPERSDFRSLLVQNTVTGCTAMLNAPLLALAKEGFPPEVRMHDWWLALIAAGTGHIAYLPKATILYRQHGANSVGAKDLAAPAGIARAMKASPREALGATYRQAHAFHECFSKRLSPSNTELARILADIPTKRKLQRILLLRKHGLVKQDLLRRIGQYRYC